MGRRRVWVGAPGRKRREGPYRSGGSTAQLPGAPPIRSVEAGDDSQALRFVQATLADFRRAVG
jgi:hypothetical protein